MAGNCYDYVFWYRFRRKILPVNVIIPWNCAVVGYVARAATLNGVRDKAIIDEVGIVLMLIQDICLYLLYRSGVTGYWNV